MTKKLEPDGYTRNTMGMGLCFKKFREYRLGMGSNDTRADYPKTQPVYPNHIPVRFFVFYSNDNIYLL